MQDHARVGEVRVGVTSADFGIAASGSVVLCHGPGRPRAASLLVESHIVLLRADRIVASLGDAMERVSWAHTSNISVITGPSRTGDIESVLTLGVHGPRHVHIFVIE
jgi:L-lactate dehydrogenase complex protein LldG